MTISETSTEINRKFVFLTMFESGYPVENFDLFKQFFLIKQVKANKYLTKTVFLHKVSHILQNYAFPLF